MNDIEKIFKGEIKAKNESIIKEIKIDWAYHTNGISNIARSIEPNFEYTEDNKKIFKLFLLYFSGNILFEDNCKILTGTKGSLSKGLLLIGSVGVGKTLIFNIFKEYTAMLKNNSFQFHNAIDIIDNVNITGVEYLEKFSDNYIVENMPKPITMYIDDIGSKNEEVNHYGSKSNVIEDLLSIRYNVFSKYNKLTHSSTNLYSEGLKENYDARIIDRIKEMFNIIELKGESFRK